MATYLYYTPIDNAETMRLYKQGLTDAEIAKKYGVSYGVIHSWRKRKGLPANLKQKPDESYLADIKQCRKCEYWRAPNTSPTSYCFCHHLLDTGRRRERGEGRECLSFTKKTRRQQGRIYESGSEDGCWQAQAHAMPNGDDLGCDSDSGVWLQEVP